MAAPDLAVRGIRRPEPPTQPNRARSAAIESRARAAEFRTSAVLLVAVLVTVAGMHVILQDVGWWFSIALLTIVLLGSAALGRRLSRRRWVPTVVAVVVFIVVLTVVFVPGTAVLGVIPTGDSFTAFGALSDEANISIARQSLPAIATTPINWLLCLGIGALAILADLLAGAFRTPALAGIPLLVILAVPSIITIDSTDPLVFVLAALAYLALLRAGSPRAETRVVLSLAAVVIAGALIVPLVLPPVTPAENTNGTGFSSGVNPVLSLGENLRRDVERPVLRYSTRSGDAEYLRLVSLEDFSGVNWAPDRFTLTTGNSPDSIDAPPGLSDDVARTEDTTFVSVDGLTSPWLPLPYPTSSVNGLSGDWYWDSNGLAVKSTNTTAREQNYRATSLAIAPTPAQLQTAGTTVPAGFERFLALPGAIPKIITTTAQKVAGGAGSNYEKALLLQDFFRDGDFEYSETAPVQDGYDGTGMDVIARFLKEKSGYCIHFASSMAVMARTLGIPSRIAVGFLPGTELPDRVDGRVTYQVTSHNLHAWPELYFEGIGWTRFEPTVGRGDVPAYADIASPDVPVPVNTPLPSTSAAPTETPQASGGPLADEPTSTPQAGAAIVVANIVGWLWILAIIVLVGLVLLIPAAIRRSERARRLRDLRSGAAGAVVAWREVLQTARDLGVDVPVTATPREAAELLRAASVPRGDGEAIDRLRAGVEVESYAVTGRGAPSTSAATVALAADTEAVIDGLFSAVGRASGMRASLVPASVWGRLLRPFGRA